MTTLNPREEKLAESRAHAAKPKIINRPPVIIRSRLDLIIYLLTPPIIEENQRRIDRVTRCIRHPREIRPTLMGWLGSHCGVKHLQFPGHWTCSCGVKYPHPGAPYYIGSVPSRCPRCGAQNTRYHAYKDALHGTDTLNERIREEGEAQLKRYAKLDLEIQAARRRDPVFYPSGRPRRKPRNGGEL